MDVDMTGDVTVDVTVADDCQTVDRYGTVPVNRLRGGPAAAVEVTVAEEFEVPSLPAGYGHVDIGAVQDPVISRVVVVVVIVYKTYKRIGSVGIRFVRHYTHPRECGHAH